jgi:acetyl esterase/lipase
MASSGAIRNADAVSSRARQLVAGRTLATARRVAPRATAWLSARRGGAPPFADLLRRAEEHGDLPDRAPESDPARLLLMYPDLARVLVSDVEIAGPHGPVPARLYRPGAPPADRPQGMDPPAPVGTRGPAPHAPATPHAPAAPLAADPTVGPHAPAPLAPATPLAPAGLVWVHGGGFISGTLDFAESHWVGLALASRGIPVLALDYRKAIRGTCYPVPLDDVAAGWRWAADRCADTLGVAPAGLHLGGASAGGTLAAGLAKRLRDTREAPPPRTQVLAYPVLHPDADAFPATAVARLRRRCPYPLMTPDDLRQVAENYAGRPEALADPYAFPALGPLTGLPPAYVLTAEFDLLRFSGEAYAAAIRQAGGTATVEMEPRAPHGTLARPAGEFGHRSLDRIAAWLRHGPQPDR